MEQTLNIKEQALLRYYRNSGEEMRKVIFAMLSQIDHLHNDLFSKSATLNCAEEFIVTSDMQEEWEETKRTQLPSYEE